MIICRVGELSVASGSHAGLQIVTLTRDGVVQHTLSWSLHEYGASVRMGGSSESGLYLDDAERGVTCSDLYGERRLCDVLVRIERWCRRGDDSDTTDAHELEPLRA
ncbi:hypothetical protein Tco_0445625 [Tanacetum coccineum]